MSRPIETFTPENYPNVTQQVDINEPGNLVFQAIADEERLVGILTEGIKPGRGIPGPGSLFPHAISLSAMGSLKPSENYQSISDGLWTVLKVNSSYRNEFRNPTSHYYQYSFFLDQDWVKEHIQEFLAVGRFMCRDYAKEFYQVGALTNIEFQAMGGSFPSEVHYTAGILSPQALRGVLIDEKYPPSFTAAQAQLHAAFSRAKQAAVPLQLPIGIYNNRGVEVDIIL